MSEVKFGGKRFISKEERRQEKNAELLGTLEKNIDEFIRRFRLAKSGGEDLSDEEVKELLLTGKVKRIPNSSSWAHDVFNWLRGELEKKIAFDRLKKWHEGNPLFKPEFEPKDSQGKVIVYHVTFESWLDKIGKVGIKPLKHLSWQGEEGSPRQIADGIFDQIAPEYYPGFSRTGSVFAYVDPKDPKTHAMDFDGLETPLVLEVLVDPKKVLVADAGFFSQATMEVGHITGGPESRARSYWETAMRLSEYLKLPSFLKHDQFLQPEVVISHSVAPDLIRITEDGLIVVDPRIEEMKRLERNFGKHN